MLVCQFVVVIPEAGKLFPEPVVLPSGFCPPDVAPYQEPAERKLVIQAPEQCSRNAVESKECSDQ